MAKPKLKFKTEQSPEANVIQSNSGRDIVMFITYKSYVELIIHYRGEKPLQFNKPIKIGIRRAA